MKLLDGWYPGLGEVEKIRRMSPFVREFIYCASKENPKFLESYLLPVLDGADSEGEIMRDIENALCAAECEEAGLGRYGFSGSWLGNVPETLGAVRVVTRKALSQEKKAITQPVHQALRQEKMEYAAAKKTKDAGLIAKEKAELELQKILLQQAKKTFQKEKLTKEDKKDLISQVGRARSGYEWRFLKDTRTGETIATQVKKKESGNFFDKAGRAISRGWQKYGNIAIMVVGAGLALFTGGASLAAASALTAANTMYQKKRESDRAKQAGRRDAERLKKEAAAAEADTTRQVDDFYRQNQSWFVNNLGVTPDKWSALTLDQKIGLLNSGTTGRPPVDPSAGVGASAPSPSVGYGTSGGGGGGGGGGSSEGGGGESFQPGAPGAPQVATAGMFDGAMLPLLAGGVALALIFGKPVKGGRRTKRNPRRRHWRVA